MIPINLAIIGAGSVAQSRMEGFRNGSIYGLGMALAYGTLGLVVVLTGSKFGTLNSSMLVPTRAIALVFVVMALGMFDVLNIDLSRFGGTAGPSGFAGKGACWPRTPDRVVHGRDVRAAGRCLCGAGGDFRGAARDQFLRRRAWWRG